MVGRGDSSPEYKRRDERSDDRYHRDGRGGRGDQDNEWTGSSWSQPWDDARDTIHSQRRDSRRDATPDMVPEKDLQRMIRDTVLEVFTTHQKTQKDEKQQTIKETVQQTLVSMGQTIKETVQPMLDTKIDPLLERIEKLEMSHGTDATDKRSDVKVDALAARLDALQGSLAGGARSVSDPCAECPMQISAVRDVLELRLPTVVTADDVTSAAESIFQQIGTSLSQLNAKVSGSYMLQRSKQTVISIKFAGGPAERTAARNKISPRVEGKFLSKAMYEGQPVKAFVPMPKYERERNRKLFQALDTYVARAGVMREDCRVDLKARMVYHDGKVTARQDLNTWAVEMLC